jgi:LPS sulfotransferase NodH
MKKPLLVVAHSRSGSTYLCQLLAAFTRVRAYLEVFHADPERMVAFLGEDWPLVRERLGLDDDPAAARNAVCDQPDRLVGCLAAIHPDATVSLKIFPPHLDARQLALLIPRCQGLVMLRRNLLHTYISRNIARATGAWSGIDTSKYAIRFTTEHFERHAARVARFYAAADSIARSHGIPVTWLDYSALCAAGDLEPVVRHALEAAGVVDAGTFRLGQISITRQDERRSALDKVVNPDELKNYATARGLGSLLDSDGDGAILYDRFA